MKAVVALVIVAFCALASAAAPKWHELESTGYDFEAYVQDFQRTYTGEERQMRKTIFEQRLSEIKAHNQLNKSWKEGVNHLTDRTESELKSLRGYKMSYAASMVESREGTPYQFKNLGLPKEVDWRRQGVVSQVKDQGQCGSCWTFATAESIESYWALATKQLAVLSEQQVLDCTPNPQQCGGTGGCGGGTVELAFAQIIKTGGLSSEWTYPYQSYWGKDFPKCSFNSTLTPVVAKLKSWVNLPVNKYEPILEAVAHEGPLAVSVDASAWSKYETGVFDGCNQTHPDLDHAVQLVGYGNDHKDGDYWLIRNSWTPAWGEEGFIRIKRTDKVVCGVDLNPKDGDGCKNGPPTVEVCGTCGILFDGVYPVVDAPK